MSDKKYKIFQVLPEMYPRIVQYEKGIYYDGSGNILDISNGVIGLQGPQGFIGGTGSGTVGNQGPQGFDGTQGYQGQIGLQGPASGGGTGPQGFDGPQGIYGNDGSNSSRWLWSDINVPVNDPGANYFISDTNNIPDITAIDISQYASNNIDYYNWLKIIDNLNPNIYTFYLQINEVGNNLIIGNYTISSITDNTTYFSLNVSYISGTGKLNNNNEYTISYVYNGINGTQGLQGAQGLTGSQGPQGNQGLVGPLGASQGSINVVFNGNGANITLGSKGFLVIPYAATITQWSLISSVTGSIVIDIHKSDFNTIANTSITGVFQPTLTNQQRALSTGLTGWTTAINTNDVLEFSVDSNSGVTWCNLNLRLTKSV